jgi:hypothetical protein
MHARARLKMGGCCCHTGRTACHTKPGEPKREREPYFDRALSGRGLLPWLDANAERIDYQPAPTSSPLPVSVGGSNTRVVIGTLRKRVRATTTGVESGIAA